MAATNVHYVCFTASSPVCRHLKPETAIAVRFSSRRRQSYTIRTQRIRCGLGPDFLGDFGARDPFPEEIESKFGEKVLGNMSTEHKILIPNTSILSLSQLECSPISPSQQPVSREEARQLLHKVLGWKLVDEDGGMKLQCLWKLRDFSCGVELINRISKITGNAGHFPTICLEQPNVRAELWTSSIGGLSVNDFIVAAKIDDIKTSDLTPRKRVWA